MKKNVLTSVTVSLAAAAMISGTAMAAEYKVGIIQFVDDASLNQIEQNIEKELTAKSEEGGNTYVFDGYVYNGQADSTTLNQITTQLLDDGVDVIVPIATPAAQIVQAATFSLKNMLGLACDPVGGLVEVPCIKRNVAGVMNAVAGAQLAMAGIRSAITPDDTIDSMRRIGNDLPVCLKETSTGGLAVTESAKRILEKISKKNL